VSNKDLLADSETENSKLEKKKNEGEGRKVMNHVAKKNASAMNWF
jgi:hypothetical protein